MRPMRRKQKERRAQAKAQQWRERALTLARWGNERIAAHERGDRMPDPPEGVEMPLAPDEETLRKMDGEHARAASARDRWK